MPGNTYAASIAAVVEASFITEDDKLSLCRRNAEVLYGEKL